MRFVLLFGTYAIITDHVRKQEHHPKRCTAHQARESRGIFREEVMIIQLLSAMSVV